jgi:hypothetical protein
MKNQKGSGRPRTGQNLLGEAVGPKGNHCQFVSSSVGSSILGPGDYRHVTLPEPHRDSNYHLIGRSTDWMGIGEETEIMK